ncbi:MAG: hypothetical protein KDE09_24515, partial [Anaerolineales bacterium]|nr:hypothetical protein [Anaerolineales bacterium]
GRRPWLWSLLLLIGALAACEGAPTFLLPTLQPLATVPAATVLAAQSAPLPTLPPTHTPIGPQPSQTPAPTSTPRPTSTPAGCQPASQVLTGSFASAVAGEEFAYQIYLPPCYGLDGRTYPALYLLGGNIHDETIWTTLLIDEAADRGISQGAYPPFIIVMPDGGYPANYTSGGAGSYETLVLDELIPYIEANYCVWGEPAGRAIGGLSRGGYWALEIAFRHADQFVSVGGHSPALLDIAAGPTLNPEYTVFNNDLGDLRLYLDIGIDDYLSGQIETWHEAIAAAGIPHIWALNPGGHDEPYWTGNGPAYLDWYTEPWSPVRASYPACTVQ